MNFKQGILACFFLIVTTVTLNVQSEAETPEPENKLQFHAIQSDIIRDIMRRINHAYYETQLDEFQREESLLENSTYLIVSVNELLVASEFLTYALPGFNLTEDEKGLFQAIALQLQIEANNIRKAAERKDFEQLNISYQRLTDTCNACHELFRF